MRAVLLLVLIAAAAQRPAFPGEIYQWVDANGHVHYGDRPVGVLAEKRNDIVSRPTNAEAVSRRREAIRDRQANYEQARALAAEAAEETADAEAENDRRRQQCEQHQARLERYLQSRRLYREDASGERVYLDEDEVLAARARVQQKIEDSCGPP